MRSLLLMLLALAGFCGVARAEDQLQIAPAPEWVTPLALPKDDGKHPDLPVKVLLLDQQVSFEDGKIVAYADIALRIQAPQGLAAGNISLPWRPELDRLIVHKLLIHREGETIDVLDGGQTFTVLRRETNLEMAMLDGELTANIQPEGLEVGDVIEIAATTITSDPTLQGHAQLAVAEWNGTPIARAHLRVRWPADKAVRVKAFGMEAPKPTTRNGVSIVDVALDNIEPVQPPKGAPARYGWGRHLEFSDFRSWAEVSALMAPLYDKAAQIPPEGRLQQELATIRARSNDPKTRAEAALALVQDRVRYVALEMGTGGLVPADAETTWARRYGDCKGKTALLLALLRELGIEAEPVIVNSQAGDGIDERLPMTAFFNHVILRAHIGGRDYWLDGTRSGDAALDRITIPAFRWGLPVLPAEASLVEMMPPPLSEPDDETRIRIDARGGIAEPAPFHAEVILRGDGAIGMNLMLKNVSGETREAFLHDFWRGRFDFVDPEKVDASYDETSGEMRFAVDGTARLEWPDGWYQTDYTSVGYRADFERQPGPDGDAPFAVSYPFYRETRETILLPPGEGYWTRRPGDDVEETVAGVEYRRSVEMTEDRVFTVVSSARSIAPEFPFAEAAAAQSALRKLADNDVYLRRPPTIGDIQKRAKTVADSEVSGETQLLWRASARISVGRFADAIADYTAVIDEDPRHPAALLGRAEAYLLIGKADEAERDLAVASEIVTHDASFWRLKGTLAEKRRDFAGAIEAFDAVLKEDPKDAFALQHRGAAYWSLGDEKRALADAQASIRSRPEHVDAYLLEANILRSGGKKEAVADLAARLAAANPDNPYALVGAARIYGALGRGADAMRMYDRALAIEPTAFIYVNRSETREAEDTTGRLADLDAALKLDPGFLEAFRAKAALFSRRGDYAAAIPVYSAALERYPDDLNLKLARGRAYARLGEDALATKDFEAARAQASDAAALNGICWTKATAGFALESALTDCDAALAKSPTSAPTLDSRGFVLLRLNRIDEAIATYDRAVAIQPKNATSFYGRALAWARKGDLRKYRADADAALALNPRVEEEFAGYGVPPPRASTAPAEPQDEVAARSPTPAAE